jgi:L-ascorbate metabolism protein UlaG (beta-lactamase superfamily)
VKITKFGHCCLLIEENGVRILTDPGDYSTQQNEVKNIDFVLITHEHNDHLHSNSLKKLLKNNPQAKIITNKSVGVLLKKEGIIFGVVENGQNFNANGILIEGFGKDHALIHSSIPLIQNTGYFIANRLFYPGDAFYNPGKQVEILALPVAAPWMKSSEAIDYVFQIKPKICFPVHDGILNLNPPGSPYLRVASKLIESKGINFVVLEINKEYEF